MERILVIGSLGIMIYFAFKFNVFLGIAVLGIILFIMYKLNYASYCEMKANMEFNKKKFDEALALYEKAYNNKHRKYSVDVAYARALMRTDNEEKALEILNNILGLNLTKEMRVSAKEARCMVLFKMKNIREAYTEARELYYEMGHTVSIMRGLLGFIMIEHDGVTKEVLEFCEEAYDYDSDNRDIVDNLAVCYYETGNYEKGLELCEDMIEDYPKFVEAWYHGAQILEAMGDKKRALEFAENSAGCERNSMTTVSEAEIDALIKKLR